MTKVPVQTMMLMESSRGTEAAEVRLKSVLATHRGNCVTANLRPPLDAGRRDHVSIPRRFTGRMC